MNDFNEINELISDQNELSNSSSSSESKREIQKEIEQVVEQAVEINIVHERDSYHCRQAGEAPAPFQPFLHYHEKEVCYKSDPYLYLDGVGALSIEVFQREVLFHLLEEQLNFPSLMVNGDDFVRIRLHVVCQ